VPSGLDLLHSRRTFRARVAFDPDLRGWWPSPSAPPGSGRSAAAGGKGLGDEPLPGHRVPAAPDGTHNGAGTLAVSGDLPRLHPADPAAALVVYRGPRQRRTAGSTAVRPLAWSRPLQVRPARYGRLTVQSGEWDGHARHLSWPFSTEPLLQAGGRWRRRNSPHLGRSWRAFRLAHASRTHACGDVAGRPTGCLYGFERPVPSGVLLALPLLEGSPRR